jgi:hypothetical protein
MYIGSLVVQRKIDPLDLRSKEGHVTPGIGTIHKNGKPGRCLFKRLRHQYRTRKKQKKNTLKRSMHRLILRRGKDCPPNDYCSFFGVKPLPIST